MSRSPRSPVFPGPVASVFPCESIFPAGFCYLFLYFWIPLLGSLFVPEIQTN